jgi:hypothetical protein
MHLHHHPHTLHAPKQRILPMTRAAGLNSTPSSGTCPLLLCTQIGPHVHVIHVQQQGRGAGPELALGQDRGTLAARNATQHTPGRQCSRQNKSLPVNQQGLSQKQVAQLSRGPHAGEHSKSTCKQAIGAGCWCPPLNQEPGTAPVGDSRTCQLEGERPYLNHLAFHTDWLPLLAQPPPCLSTTTGACLPSHATGQEALRWRHANTPRPFHCASHPE